MPESLGDAVWPATGQPARSNRWRVSPFRSMRGAAIGWPARAGQPSSTLPAPGFPDSRGTAPGRYGACPGASPRRLYRRGEFNLAIHFSDRLLPVVVGNSLDSGPTTVWHKTGRSGASAGLNRAMSRSSPSHRSVGPRSVGARSGDLPGRRGSLRLARRLVPRRCHRTLL